MTDGRSLVAVHGAVYGRNFGDVIIQRLLATNLAKHTNLGACFPFGSPDFLADLTRPQPIRPIFRRSPNDRITAACWGPGGYFGERPFGMSAWHQRLENFHGPFLRYIRDRGIPSAVFGVGVGPLSMDRSVELVADALNAAKCVFVRDHASYEHAVSFGVAPERVMITPDAIFLLEAAGQRNALHPRKRIGLHPADISQARSEVIFRLIDEIGIFCKKNSVECYLIADGPNQHPKDLIEHAYERIPGLTEIAYSSPDQLIHVMSQLDCTVTTKLHVGLCTFALGALPVALYEHPKILDQYKELGIEGQCLPLVSLDEKWLQDAIHRSLETPPDHLQPKLQQLRSDAHANVRTVAQSLGA